MHSFDTDKYCLEQSPFHLGGHEIDKIGGCVADDLEELLQSSGNGIHRLDSADISRICWMYNGLKASNVSVISGNLQFGGIPNSFGSAETGSSGVAVERGQFMLSAGVGGGGNENWGDSGVVPHHIHSYQIETATDNHDQKNQLAGIYHQRSIAGDSTEQSKGRIRDQKELVKLAQNREAARKSRMRKKAYLQQLEKSQQRLTELHQALGRARHQVASGILSAQSHSAGGRGFERDHARWLDEHERLMDDLRSALSCDEGEKELHLHVDAVFCHYGKFFGMKSAGARSDLWGIWRSPVERCLMWLGGFRSSDLLKVVEKQIQMQAVSEQQLVGICKLQQSCQQTEDALSQGMEALQQSLLDTLSSTRRVVDYATQMGLAMTSVEKIQNFLNQADLLRLHTLQQLQRILTTRQAARALLAINDYKTRLRALSSLWLARPRNE